MATVTINHRKSTPIRIQEEEKIFLSKLRQIYGNEYKKYVQHITRESNVPASIKKIYKPLDEYQAYRRISDHLHRKRRHEKRVSPQRDGLRSSNYRLSTRHNTSISTTQVDQEMSDNDDIYQQTNISTTTNNNGEVNDIDHTIEDNIHDIQSSPSINLDHPHKRRLSPINSKSDLLSVRASLRKALQDLDRVLIPKSDPITEENNPEQYRPSTSSIEITPNHCHSKLDDLVRSLSTVVNQQQENARLIITDTSALLVDDTKSTQDSIKHTLERLNTLVDRGHVVYDKIENILSKIW